LKKKYIHATIRIMKKNFFILFIATSAFAAPVPLDIDLFSTANFTGAQSAAGTAINITNGSTVNFQDQSDPDSAPISVSNDSFLNFSETTPTIYSGQLTGSGTVTKNGTGNLTMSGNNSGFTGPLFVQSGTLFLDGAYGGSVTSSASAHIVYKGPISGNLDITSGTITTAGINTLQVGGNYTQAPNTIYIANLSSSGQSSLINIAGTASIAGSVQIDASLGVLTNHTYEILHANGGVSGTYGLINPYPALKVSITYDANNVYLSFGSSLLGLAATPNEKNVAK
jgi:autotransporter-associated beta strand protein